MSVKGSMDLPSSVNVAYITGNAAVITIGILRMSAVK
jgi:hypothetical protein